MKRNKRIIAASLAAISVLALCSCDAKPNNKTIPYGSLSDNIFASAANGKYTITEKQLYTKLRQNSYDKLTKEIYSIVFADDIQNVISNYGTDSETTKDVDKAIAQACYSSSNAKTLSELDSDSIKESKQKYIDTMAASGIVVTETELEFQVSDTNSDERFDTISFPNITSSHDLVEYYAYDLGLINASNDYYASIADEEQIWDYSKEQLVDNAAYVDEDDIESRYNDSYKDYNTTKAIIIRFNSARDANNAIEKVEAKLGSEINNSNALNFFVELYNTYYSYRNNLTITDGKLDITQSLTYITDKDYTELNSISSSFMTFYQDALVDGGNDTAAVVEGSYTAFPRSIDDKYFMVYRINTEYLTGTAEPVDFDELETMLGTEKADEIKNQMKQEVIENKASASAATSTVFKNMLIDGDNDHEADDILDIKIYDPYYEYKFYNTYANEDYYDYIAKKEFNNDLIASVTLNGKTTDISIQDFYNKLVSVNGAETATTYLLNQYLEETYKDEWLDEDDLETIEDSFDEGVKTFKKDEASIPKFLGLKNYYTINYGYETKAEIFTQNLYASLLASKYSSTYYRDGYFIETDDSYTINEDVKVFKNILEYTAKVYQTLYTIDLSHFLISVDNNCDGTMDDPQQFMAELETQEEKDAFQNAVTELAKALISEAQYIDTDIKTALDYLVKAYNQGLELQSEGYKGKTWDDFKYTYNFKITVESLGEITQATSSSYVKPFASYIEETYKQVTEAQLDVEDASVFFVNNVTTAEGKTDINSITVDNLCETVYGYHVLVVNDYEEPSNAYYSSTSDSNGDYAEIKVIVDELDEDDDDDDIYFVTNAYNESTTNISINQLYIYYYEKLVAGSVTSLSSNLKNAISTMADTVINRYTNSSFQSWLQLDELGEITFNNPDSMTYTYDDYIKSLVIAIDGYDPDETFNGWFDLEWK